MSILLKRMLIEGKKETINTILNQYPNANVLNAGTMPTGVDVYLVDWNNQVFNDDLTDLPFGNRTDVKIMTNATKLESDEKILIIKRLGTTEKEVKTGE